MKKIKFLLILLLILPFTVLADSYLTDSIGRSTSNCLYRRLNIDDTISVINFESVDDINITGIDLSKDGDNSVIANVDYDNDLLTIQFKGKLVLPEDSSYLFLAFVETKEINGLEYFDVSNVTNMYGLFGNCRKLLSVDLSNWNTSNVTDMGGLFANCNSINNLDLSNFDTRKVNSMKAMFQGCNVLDNLNISGFVTSNVTNMASMFINCNYLECLDLSEFDVSNVENMNSMFSGCWVLKNLNLDNWNTRSLLTINNMFNNCQKITSLDLSHFDTSNVTNISLAFFAMTSLTSIDISTWDVSNVTNMSGIFGLCYKLEYVDLSRWNTSSLKIMYSMFTNGGNKTKMALKKVDFGPGWDTSKVDDMSQIFYECTELESLDLSYFDTSISFDFNKLFYDCAKLKTIYVSDKWDLSEGTDFTNMFYNCTSLVGESGQEFDSSKVDNTYANYENGYLTLAPTVTVKSGSNLFGNILKISKNIFSNVKELFSSNNDWDHNDSDIINTGETISIMSDDNIFRTYTISYNGDTNGDGKINYIDYVRVYNHINNKKILKNSYLIAADYNNDNEVNSSDYSKIYNDIKR